MLLNDPLLYAMRQTRFQWSIIRFRFLVQRIKTSGIHDFFKQRKQQCAQNQRKSFVINYYYYLKMEKDEHRQLKLMPEKRKSNKYF